MTTEQELREEVKSLEAQVQNLVTDNKRLQEDKRLANKGVYDTLAKYEKTLRFFKKVANAIYTHKEEVLAHIFNEYHERLDNEDSQLLSELASAFPDEYENADKHLLLKRWLTTALATETNFAGFLLVCKLFFDKALDPKTLPEDISGDDFLVFTANLAGETAEKFKDDLNAFWGKK